MKKEIKIDIYFDGACHNIPNKSNPMGMGVAVFVDGQYMPKESVIAYNSGRTDRGTSNVAEWIACSLAMKKAADVFMKYQNCKITIYSDSSVITSQFNGDFEVHKYEFRKYKIMAQKFAEQAMVNKIVWIRRTFNKKADELSKRALKRYHESANKN